MILHTMTLAVQIKLTASTKQTSASNAAVDERDLKLQQTENVVQASYQSLRELKETEFAPDRSGEDATDDEPAAEDYGQNQLMLWRDATGDTAGWLYAVVFSAYAECRAEGEYDNDHGDPSEKDDNTHSPSFNSGQGWVGDLSLRVTQKPINPRKVVDELLAEWTELSNDEIKGSILEDVEGQEEDDTEISKNIDAQEVPTPQKQTERQVQEPVQQMRTSYENRHTGGVEVIDFKDAVGRKFTLPYHEIRRWRDMEEIVKQAFLHTSFTSESSDDEDNESTVEAASVPTKPRKTEKPEEQSEEPEKRKKNIVTRFGLWLSK
ncbi:hypothetical protein K4K59_009371 [Colletotrichum sp. SAR11_240]|nr:hypothetical protein K4K59_009371 [Colletotrichum sp. SAR11_240]